MKKLLWVPLILLLVTAGCSKKDNSKVLMSLGSEKITMDDFQRRIDKIPPYLLAYFQDKEGTKTLVDGLLKEQLLIREARRQKLDKNKELEAKVREIEDQLLVEEMVKELKNKEIAVTEQEAEAYFRKNKESFATADKIKVKHILLKTDKEAKAIMGKLKKGEDFDKLAGEYSIDKTSAAKGGDLGYFSRGDLVPEFEKAAFALENPGQISNIVKTPFGYHIIQLVDKKQKDQIALADVSEEVKKRVEKEKFDKWMENMKTKFKVKVNYDLLNNFQFKKPVAPLTEEGGVK
ncbi:MAG: peptidylprolyl isomerase [bacterium]